MAGLGIVIVTYNSEAEIGPCLEAALATGAQVIVVDNASADGTLAEIRRHGVALIANAANRGFAGAVNQCVRAIPPNFSLFLIPNAIFHTAFASLPPTPQHP